MHALCLLAAGAGWCGPWRTYEVYGPAVERCFVVNATESDLKYNHDSTIAWFGDRWICVWNANQVPYEGKPGQLNYMSTSPDGRTWSEPEPAFSNEARAENPIPCPTGTQWQPNLIVVGGELWCMWSQNSRDDYGGCYFSVLREPDGKWANRRLLWDGDPQPEIEGKRFRIFPTQNLAQLSSGRVLAPVTLIGPEAADAPEVVQSWWRTEKRDSVLYSDDGGDTWEVSPGAMLPHATWAQWEPTVWETADGSVMMFARNNDFRDPETGGPRATEALVWSVSHDGGETWTPHEFVPLETVVSRMHVLPLAGRFMMVHNDWPAGRFVQDRKNLALFFTRGAGIDFVAGPSVAEREPFVMYPQMWIRDDEVLISYSQGNLPRSIKVAHLSPLPRSYRYYVYPRGSTWTVVRPREVEGALAFDGAQYVKSREVLDPGERFSAGAWLRPDGGGVLLDNRTTTPQAGFLWGLTMREDGLHPFLYVGSPEHNLVSSLVLPATGWTYLGLTVDHVAGMAEVYVGEQSERLTYSQPANALKGTTLYVGHKRFEGSQVPAFIGDIKRLFVAPGQGMTRDEQAAALGALGDERLERPPALAEEGFWLDAADRRSWRGLNMPEGVAEGIEVGNDQDGSPVLRIAGEASAGLDLDENRRDRDVVSVVFAFQLELGDEHVLCTVGDALEPARVLVRQGEILLEAGEERVVAGRCEAEG